MRYPPPLQTIALLLLLNPLRVAAQQPDTVPVLPEVKVSVGRSPTALASFGGAVTVVEGTAISRQRLATGLDETLAFVPGVVVSNRWNPSLDQRLIIRGFGARANFGIRGVKVLIDGVPQTLPDGQSQLTNLDLAQLDRVEVLRGAASALHGNAAGGVVSFTSRAAPGDGRVGVEVGTEVGTFDSRRSQLRLTAGGARLRGSLGGSRLITDGFRRQSAAEQRRLTGALDFTLTRQTTFLIRAAWADDPRAENPGALTVAEAASNPGAPAPNNLLRRADKAVTQGQVALGLDHAGRNWNAELRTWFVTRDLDNPLAAPAPAPTTAAEGLWVGIDRRVVGVRSSLTRQFVGGGRVTGGIDLQRGRDDRINRRHLAGVPTGEPLLDQRETVTELGGFAQADLPLVQGFAFRAGLRRDAVRFRVADRLTTSQGGSRTLSATTAHLGLTWRSAVTTAWLSRATSFETPTTTELANRPDGTTGINRDLDPQRSRSVEAGLRTTALGMAIEVAGWHTRTRQAITPFQEVGGRSFFINAGVTRSRGAELSWRAPIGAGLLALASYTLTDATFRDFERTTADTTVSFSGNRIAGVPRHQFRLGVRGAVGRLVLDVDHALLSSQFADDANLIEVPGWDAGITGLRVSTRIRQGTAQFLAPFVAIQNLWGRDVIGSVTVNGAFGRVMEPSPGRVVSVGVVVGGR
jgi:iron complex outermembrane receptor protein